jgi:hypothetical protein
VIAEPLAFSKALIRVMFEPDVTSSAFNLVIAEPLATSKAPKRVIALPEAVSKLPKRLLAELVYDNIDELNVLNELTDVKALLSKPSNNSAFAAYDAVIANEAVLI